MAITKAQEIALYQILEIPWQAVATHLIDGDNMVGLQLTIQATSTRQAKQMLTDYLTAYIYTDTATQTVLTTLLDRWNALGTTTVRIESGGTGAIAGVTMDPREEREEISRQVKVIVPFYRRHEELERAHGGQSSVQIVR
jgi:hypothetical protein